MLFMRYSPDRSTQSAAPPSPDTQSVSSRGAQSRAWALKSFATGVSVLGIAYCLVQVAGVQYLATLTSVSLLAFLLVYLVWCATSRRRHQLHQQADGVLECGEVGPRVTTVALPSCSSAVELHDAELLRSLAQAGVFVGAKPPRAVTPPPSYEEAIRNMPPPPQQS